MTPTSSPRQERPTNASSLLGTFARAAVLLASLSVLTGVLYPLAVTAVAQLAFPTKASGDLLRGADGAVIGARSVGQSFDDPRYVWGRPSATRTPYDAHDSAGSNLGPTNPALRARVIARIAALRAADPENDAPVPVDLVTASGSGLDPHVSPAAARYQAARVARARGLPEDRVLALIEAHTEGRDLGILGEPRVNVLALNLSLDRASSR